MPFKIIRNDITKVHADAIVNTANPQPIYANGTDRAVYEAAGSELLLEERKKIGEIARGDAAVTKAYHLHAKYIIHTVGPIWKDGTAHEFEILESCYTKSLEKAVELECTSIAFPLIATGVYGFPKDKALQIAISVFSRFLMTQEMQIILVVFDKKAFQLSRQMVGEIDSYIDANYVKEYQKSGYPGEAFGNRRGHEEREEENRRCFESRILTQKEVFYDAAPLPPEPERMPSKHSLEEELNQLGPTFHEKLFELLGQSGMENKEIWKAANLDRKHFSKIQCDAGYHPKKKTVMALCIALKLNLEQAVDLMARADWAFSPSSKFDLIVKKAILDHQYDIMQLNVVLFQYTNQVLGV